MRWLVAGSSGMLGQDLVSMLEERGEHVTALALPELDVIDPQACIDAARGHDVVANCTAYTAVDAAESDEAAAFGVNAVGAANLARAARLAGARMVHVSTDYVFPGDAATPYPEDATPAPRTAYGRTKLAGERAVLAAPSGAGGTIVRTAWLYGAHGHNFVRTMIELSSKRDTLDVVDDQFGQPTWAADVAERLVALGRRPSATGIFHATSSGVTSWFHFTREIFRLIAADPERVHPTTSAAFPRPAPRPAYSALGHDRWKEIGLEPIRDWRAALREALPTIRKESTGATP